MKRFGLFLLLLLSVFTLTACDKDTDLQRVEKDINKVFDTYTNSLKGSVKFESGTAEDLLVSELMYVFKLTDGEKVLDQLMVKQVEGDEEWSLFVKDQVGYIHNEGEKIKETLTADDLKLKEEEFGFSVFVQPVAEVFNEDFFAAAEVISVDESKMIIELDLDKYEGTLINQSGEITKFEVVVEYTDKAITKIQNNITRDGKVHIISVTFNSTSEVEIDFPDFTDYQPLP